ncbi:LysE family translocator [Litorivicinus sp.]|mgnify:CR=1 FL=1|jgi:homoserine/homoserine lactone efflux protein|nr:LysE family translocator [Litorivicinus sp.]
MKLSLLGLFVPTFFFVSVTPGLCMTLALTLGMTIGVRRTLWMMAGELVGVALVVLATLAGVAAIMLEHPDLFIIFKLAGGTYLAYLGVQLWRSKGKMAITTEIGISAQTSRRELISQGFITAISNPKGWAFFVALLPPFIDYQQPVASQISIMLVLILLLEFICLIAYASGGSALSRYLQNRANVQTLNRIAGSLMLGVSLWLAFG